MRSLKVSLLAGLGSCIMHSPSYAQDQPPPFDSGPAPHSQEFTEGGAKYVLSSPNGAVYSGHVAVARQIIQYCADNVLTIQILPANPSTKLRAAADKQLERVKIEKQIYCEQNGMVEAKQQHALRPDIVLSRK